MKEMNQIIHLKLANPKIVAYFLAHAFEGVLREEGEAFYLDLTFSSFCFHLCSESLVDKSKGVILEWEWSKAFEKGLVDISIDALCQKVEFSIYSIRESKIDSVVKVEKNNDNSLILIFSNSLIIQVK